MDDQAVIVNFSLVRGGPAYRLLTRAGLSPSAPRQVVILVFVLVAVAWLPLLIITGIEHPAVAPGVHIAFFDDLAIYARVFLAIPILLLSEPMIENWTTLTLRHLVSSCIVPRSSLGEFNELLQQTMHKNQSTVVEVALLAIAIVTSMLGVGRLAHLGISTWYVVRAAGGFHLTAAGIWYTAITNTIIIFLLFRWIWRYLNWSSLLASIARLPLSIMPAHPDLTGGMTALGSTQALFGTLAGAVGAVIYAGLANHIRYQGAKIDILKVPTLVFAGLVIGVIVGPLTTFIPPFVRAKRDAILHYGDFVTRYVRLFTEKWITHPGVDELLGTPDIQSMNDLGFYQNIQNMRILPFSLRHFLLLLALTALPILPVLLFAFPTEKIIEAIYHLVSGLFN